MVGILGAVEVVGPHGRAELTGGRHRALVGALALQPGAVVPTWRLVEALWGEEPPRTALRSLHSHVARLRQALSRCGLDGVVQTREPGYALCVDPADVDAARFERAVETVHSGAQDPAAVLREALDLWRGPALADADPAGWVAAEAERLERLRRAALADRCEALLAAGRSAEALTEAERLVAAEPLQERVAGLHMLALARCGRTAEALEAYRRLREALAEELGVDPSPELSELHTALLRGERQHRDLLQLPAVTRPAQLPPPVGWFTGRAAELRALDEAAAETGVVLVRGHGGIGKTALAVQWAHRVAERFGDGQLFVDLRGHDPATALSPAEVAAVLLRCLGVPDDRMPHDLSERIATYRTLLAGRRMLVVLDDAGRTDQVTPALPGAGASLLLVTSRHQLPALVTHAEVRAVALDVLGREDAARLLTRVVGADRVAREAAAAERLVSLCGRMPLALRIAAAKLVTEPGRSIAASAGELERDRLAHLGVEDDARSVAAVFDSAYRTLSPPARQLFRRLSLHPGPHVAAALCSALAPAAGLAELTAAHLVMQPAPGRCRMHDLIRAYGRGRTDERERATTAELIMDWYLVSAHAANQVLDSSQDRIAPVLRHPAPPVPFGPTRAAALAFLEAELPNLPVLVRHAAQTGQEAAACQLTYLLSGFFGARGNWSERVDMCRPAIAAARRLGDRAVEAEMHRALGVAYRATYRLEPALASHLRALALLRELGDERGLAYVYNNIGGANAELRRFPAAIAAYRLSLRLHTATGNRHGAVAARRNLGYTYIRMDRVERSFEHLEAALAASREIGYRRLEAGALDSLGEAHLRQGSFGAARACFDGALTVSRAIGDLRYEMDALVNLGLTALAMDAAAEAVERFTAALAVSRRLGHRHAEARILNRLGEARLRLGDVAAAGELLRASGDLRAGVPDPYEEACLHGNLAALAERTGRAAAADRHRTLAAGLVARLQVDGMVTVASAPPVIRT
ncbi:SARP family transcriptional regulator [Dactylosporangium sucinum]|uniref:SARP family transcriptional regulator n=1 Tax=Dactylosporangium sucinum TaxID=1424081 RepID=A0A917WUA5_9ACTN|nr:SARP family transcriptional regulator [Dactylosporangium sucinum]